jgi:hypothetical protein
MANGVALNTEARFDIMDLFVSAFEGIGSGLKSAGRGLGTSRRR